MKTYLSPFLLLCLVCSFPQQGYSNGKNATTDGISNTTLKTRLNALNGGSIPTTRYTEREVIQNKKTTNMNDFPQCAKSFPSNPELISPFYSGSSAPTSYCSDFEGAIQNISSVNNRTKDVDLLEFAVYGRAKITVTLSNIASGRNYDLELLKHVVNDHGVNPDATGNNKLVSMSTSKRSSNYSENITYSSLTANTYYLRISSPNNTYSDQRYHVVLTVEYLNSDKSIKEMRYHNGAKGAFWISDFDPGEIAAFSSWNQTQIGKGTIEGRSDTITNPIYSFVEQFDRIHHSSLIVWDPELRNCIADVLTQFALSYDSQKTEIEKKFAEEKKKNDDIKWILTCVEYAVGAMISVACPAAGITVKALVAATFQAATLDLAFTALGNILQFDTSNMERKIKELSDLTDLMVNAKNVFECGEDVEECVCYESFYTLKANSEQEHIVDFTPTLSEKLASHIYNQDTITAFDSKAHFSGTIYPLRDQRSIDLAKSKGTPYFPLVNTCPPIDIQLDIARTDYLRVGEYKWYKFTAPTDGKYSFYSEGSQIDVYGELAMAPDAGKDLPSRIDYNDDGAGYPNFKMQKDILAGQAVYLRVRQFAWNDKGTYSVRVVRIGNYSGPKTFNGSNLGLSSYSYSPKGKTYSTTDAGNAVTVKSYSVKNTSNNIEIYAPGLGDIYYLDFYFSKPIAGLTFTGWLERGEDPDSNWNAAGFYYELLAMPHDATYSDENERDYNFDLVEEMYDYEYNNALFTFDKPAKEIRFKLSLWARGAFDVSAKGFIHDITFRYSA